MYRTCSCGYRCLVKKYTSMINTPVTIASVWNSVDNDSLINFITCNYNNYDNY